MQHECGFRLCKGFSAPTARETSVWSGFRSFDAMSRSHVISVFHSIIFPFPIGYLQDCLIVQLFESFRFHPRAPRSFTPFLHQSYNHVMFSFVPSCPISRFSCSFPPSFLPVFHCLIVSRRAPLCLLSTISFASCPLLVHFFVATLVHIFVVQPWFTFVGCRSGESFCIFHYFLIPPLTFFFALKYYLSHCLVWSPATHKKAIPCHSPFRSLLPDIVTFLFQF